jgi:hypothetical protein
MKQNTSKRLSSDGENTRAQSYKHYRAQATSSYCNRTDTESFQFHKTNDQHWSSIVKLRALSTVSKHRVMAMQIVMINLNVLQSMNSDLQKHANVTMGKRKRKKKKKKRQFI